MKIAAAKALAELAREDVPDQVAAAFLGRQVNYGPDYIIPAPVRSAPHQRSAARPSPRRRWRRAWRAGRSSTWRATSPSSRAGSIRSPAGSHIIFAQVRNAPKRIIFAEGRAAADRARRQRLPQRRPRPAGPDRPPCPRSRRRSPRAGIAFTDAIETHDTSRGRPPPRVCRVPLRPPAAQGLPAARLPAPRQQRPQRIRRLHGGHGPCRRHGDGRHAQLAHGLRGCAQGARRQGRPARDRRVASR